MLFHTYKDTAVETAQREHLISTASFFQFIQLDEAAKCKKIRTRGGFVELAV